MFLCIHPLKNLGNAPGKLQKTFPTGEGGPPQRWMRGGTALPIVGTTGAKVDLPSLTVGNGLCAVPGRGNYNPYGQNGTTHRHVIPSERPRKALKNLPRRGRGTARRRWMRGGTALCIVGTTGAKVDIPSLTVGNGLCAVPLRCKYNPWGQNGTTHRSCHSERTQ